MPAVAQNDTKEDSEIENLQSAVSWTPAFGVQTGGRMWWVYGGISAAVFAFAAILTLLILWTRSRWINKRKKSKLSAGSPIITTLKDPWGTTTGDSSPPSPGNFSSDISLVEEEVQPKSRFLTWPPTKSEEQYSVPYGLETIDTHRSDNGDSSSYGMIYYSMKFDEVLKCLTVHLIRAKHLKGRSRFYVPVDPFVRISLLPDEANYHQTSVKPNSSSPKFNETFQFTMEPDEIAQRSLKISVYDIDKRKVRRSLGHVSVPLDVPQLKTGDAIWSKLQKSPTKQEYIGEMSFSLCCNPVSEKIKISDLAVAGLSSQLKEDPDIDGVYILVELNHGRKCIKHKETTIHHLCIERTDFRDTFTFGASLKHFEALSLSFTLMIRKIQYKDRTTEEEEDEEEEGEGDAADDDDRGERSYSPTPYAKVVVGPFMFAREIGRAHV